LKNFFFILINNRFFRIFYKFYFNIILHIFRTIFFRINISNLCNIIYRALIINNIEYLNFILDILLFILIKNIVYFSFFINRYLVNFTFNSNLTFKDYFLITNFLIYL